MHASDTTVQKIQLQFDTQFGFNDSMWKGITANDLGYNAQDLRGLITVNGAVFGTPTATEVVVDLFRSTMRCHGGASHDFVLIFSTTSRRVCPRTCRHESTSAGAVASARAGRSAGVKSVGRPGTRKVCCRVLAWMCQRHRVPVTTQSSRQIPLCMHLQFETMSTELQ